MNERFVLNRKTLDLFLDCMIDEVESTEGEIEALVEYSNYYTAEIHCNNYFLAKNIQAKIDNERLPNGYVRTVFGLTEHKCFFLEEMGRDFMKFIIGHVSNRGIDLDNHIVELQADFINKFYGKQVYN